jgi:hypothetical protein
VCGVAGFALFLKMIVELNRVLPPEKRIPLIQYREHDIRGLHGQYFPVSRLRVGAFVLMTVFATLVAAGVIADVIAGSSHP